MELSIDIDETSPQAEPASEAEPRASPVQDLGQGDSRALLADDHFPSEGAAAADHLESVAAEVEAEPRSEDFVLEQRPQSGNFSLDLGNLDLSLSPARDSPRPIEDDVAPVRRISSDTYVRSSPTLANLDDLKSPIVVVSRARPAAVTGDQDVEVSLELSGIEPLAGPAAVPRHVAAAEDVFDDDDDDDEASLLIANQLRLSGEVTSRGPANLEVQARGRILSDDRSILVTEFGRGEIQNSFLMNTNFRYIFFSLSPKAPKPNQFWLLLFLILTFT